MDSLKASCTKMAKQQSESCVRAQHSWGERANRAGLLKLSSNLSLSSSPFLSHVAVNEAMSGNKGSAGGASSGTRVREHEAHRRIVYPVRGSRSSRGGEKSEILSPLNATPLFREPTKPVDSRLRVDLWLSLPSCGRWLPRRRRTRRLTRRRLRRPSRPMSGKEALVA